MPTAWSNSSLKTNVL